MHAQRQGDEGGHRAGCVEVPPLQRAAVRPGNPPGGFVVDVDLALLHGGGAPLGRDVRCAQRQAGEGARQVLQDSSGRVASDGVGDVISLNGQRDVVEVRGTHRRRR